MPCSISTRKSGSNWLDRLRSSKGFPAADQIDLEKFLTQYAPNSSNTNVTDSTANQIYPNSSSNSAQPESRPVANGNPATEINGGDGEREWCGSLSNVLSELFYMGNTNNLSKKKSCRKQRNPKICQLSVSKINETASLSSDNSFQKKEMSSQLKLRGKEGLDEGPMDGEEERGNADLSGFSQTEVTVIDTSFPTWKSDKLLFRRKNVWKVRDGKCKLIIANKRKRKGSLASEEGCSGEGKKQCISSKDMDGEEGIVPSHGGNGQSKKIGACKQTHSVHGQVQENRVPKKSEDCSSSVVLIKSVPTTKKNGARILKSCAENVQSQHQV